MDNEVTNFSGLDRLWINVLSEDVQKNKSEIN